VFPKSLRWLLGRLGGCFTDILTLWLHRDCIRSFRRRQCGNLIRVVKLRADSDNGADRLSGTTVNQFWFRLDGFRDLRSRIGFNRLGRLTRAIQCNRDKRLVFYRSAGKARRIRLSVFAHDKRPSILAGLAGSRKNNFPKVEFASHVQIVYQKKSTLERKALPCPSDSRSLRGSNLRQHYKFLDVLAGRKQTILAKREGFIERAERVSEN
jgi:hypothetical protein